jgi:hypothetical protein
LIFEHENEKKKTKQETIMISFIYPFKESSDASEFAEMLSEMEEGEQVAVRVGSNKMASFQGSGGSPVTNLRMIVSGVGALPALEMLREVRLPRWSA